MSEQSQGTHKPGRPSKAEQHNMRRVLWPYFQRKDSAERAAEITGYDPKTVRRIFNTWNEEIEKSEMPDVIAREKKAKRDLLMMYQYLLEEEKSMMDDIKNAIKIYREKKVPVPRYLADLHGKKIKSLREISEKIAGVEAGITTGESLDKIVEEAIKKYGKNHPSNKR